jgi:hypothetical protein
MLKSTHIPHARCHSKPSPAGRLEYARKGIYVLWLLQWTPTLNARRYTPRLWEKWIHAAYFGRMYYWIEGLTVASYHFVCTYSLKEGECGTQLYPF